MTPVAPAPTWIDALLASEVWDAQRRLIGRAPLPEDLVRSVFACASRRGGVASYAAIANDAEIPSARLPGFLATLARVLNVDSYVVFDVDATAQEVRLTSALVAQQFQVEVTDQ